MRSWGIMYVDDLTEWMRSHGLPATGPRQHFSARAQEFILQEGCRTHARVALLETVLVLTTLHQGRVSGVPQAARTIPTTLPPRSGACPIPAVLPTGSWELGRGGSVRVVRDSSVNVEDLPYLLPREVAPVFQCGLARAPQGQAGGRHACGRACVEVVRVDPDDVVASAKRYRGCWPL